jgi:predicted phage-related endonuclease
MIEHHIVQGSPGWLAHRTQFYNASDAPAMMGLSKYKTRTQLLAEYASGITPTIDAGTQALFDEGHRAEALGRPLAERIIGQDLYPKVGSSGKFSASFDGLTMADEIAYEHKSLNDELRSILPEDSEDPGFDRGDFSVPMMYAVQMEQQCLVSGCERVLFMASKWRGDTLVEYRWCWYLPDKELRAKIIAGWAQFEQDLQSYISPQPAAPAAVASVIEQLPALVVNVEGRVVASNLEAFRGAASTFLAKIKTNLDTDQDFADAEKTVKFCADGEERLELVKAQALAQTSTIDELFRTIDFIKEEMRQKRLTLEKLVKLRKEGIRIERVNAAQAILNDHRAMLNKRLGSDWLANFNTSFVDAIKNKRTIASLQDAIDGVVASTKIEMNAKADTLDLNRKALVGQTGIDYFFLFADFASVGLKPAEDFQAIAAARIAKHAADEKARQDAKAAADAAIPVPAIVAAPVTVAVPAQATVIPAAAATPTVETQPPISAGTIGARLSFTLTVDFIEGVLGIKHSGQDKRAMLWRESDWSTIKAAIVDHVRGLP